MGCLGAIGQSSVCGSARNSFHMARLLSMLGIFFLNFIFTHARCPSETGTRLQCAEICMPLYGAHIHSFISPSILSGSCSVFSYSPPMYGTTLSIISSDATPG